MEPKIIIHGGAWDIPKLLHKKHLEGIENALNIGMMLLKNSDNPIKTVIEIIKDLENNPTFDAGKGSFLNKLGKVEMDAGIMVGEDLSVGAVAGIQNVKHPINVAELVRTKTQHALLVGEGASEFSRTCNIPFYDTEKLLVGREKKLYHELLKKKKVEIKSFFERKLPSDTVGAVVINSKGRIAVGTSTGGTPHKMAGRVGDSPIPGAGFYADDEIAGVSSTGWGEGILRIQLARETVNNIQAGLSPSDAAKQAIALMHKKVNGDGGVIVIDKNGETAFAHNTPFMAVGIANLSEIELLSIGDN